MGAKVIRDRFAQGGGSRRRRRRRSPGPEGRGAGGYAGQDTVEGDKVEVNCAPEGAAAPAGKKDKKKFPWGTVLITGAVTAVGLSIGYKVFEKVTGKEKAESNPRPSNHHDMLMAMPGAGNSITPFSYMQNQGPSDREIQLLEREAQLRERLAELEGFIAAQAMQSQQKSDLQRVLEQMEDD